MGPQGLCSIFRLPGAFSGQPVCLLIARESRMAWNVHPLDVHALRELLQPLEVLLVDHFFARARPPPVLLPTRYPAGDSIDGEHAVRVQHQLADVLSLGLLDGFACCMDFRSLVSLSPRKSNAYI